MSNKELANRLKAVVEDFSCEDKQFEDGFVTGVFFSTMAFEHGFDYANSKMNWKAIGRDMSYNYNGTQNGVPNCGCN